MKYKGNLPDDRVNIPKDSFLLQALKLLLSLALFIVVFYAIITLVLNLIINYLPAKYEKKLVQFVSFDIDLDNRRSSDYLDEITKTISDCAKLPYDVKTFIIPLDEVNAFALPGGTIYITEGMLKRLKNQNELVAVLGHEMGHFQNRDHLRSFGSSLIFSLLSLALGEGYGTILNSTLNISNAKFSQSAEFESDAFALDMMQCAYKTVTDATTLFERMNKGENWDYFLASHPSFEKRIQMMKERIIEKNYNTTLKSQPLKELYTSH